MEVTAIDEDFWNKGDKQHAPLKGKWVVGEDCYLILRNDVKEATAEKQKVELPTPYLVRDCKNGKLKEFDLSIKQMGPLFYGFISAFKKHNLYQKQMFKNSMLELRKIHEKISAIQGFDINDDNDDDDDDDDM